MLRRLMLLVCVLLSGPQAGANEPPTTQPIPYFPITKGATWKYRVTAKDDDVAQRPYVQTLTVGDPITADTHTVTPLGDDVYELKPDGIYLFGHRLDGKIVPLSEAQKVFPTKPRTGDAWNFKAGDETTYATCLGAQPITLDSGKFETQCIFSSTSIGDTGSQRQVYRYYARDIGLVREHVVETKPKPDGAVLTHEIDRDLLAYALGAPLARPIAPAASPIGTDTLHGRLLDPAGEPMAQVPIVLHRIDKPESIPLQTDAGGEFAIGRLEPAGIYLLTVQVAGYAEIDRELHSDDGRAVQVELRLTPTSASASTGSTLQSLFDEGRILAQQREHEKAIEKYDLALANDRNQPNIWAYRAISHLALRQFEPAGSDIGEALKLNNQEPSFFEIAGQIEVAQGNIPAGRRHYDKAAQLSPKDAGTTYVDYAAALAALHDDKYAGEIEAALKLAAAATPPSAEALFQLGQSYAKAGRQEGRDYLQRFLDLSSQLPESQRDAQKIQVARQLIKALDALRQP